MKSHCPRGHPYSGANLYLDPRGQRRCRTCRGQEQRTSRRDLSGACRHNRDKTHCPRGHPYSGANLYVDPRGNRRCRACKAEDRSAARNSDMPAAKSVRVANRDKSHCPKGHPYGEGNLYIDPAGKRHCRACKREAYRAVVALRSA